MNYRNLVLEKDVLIGFLTIILLMTFMAGIFTFSHHVNFNNPWVTVEDSGLNNTDYKRTTCEIAKYRINATLYFNESLEKCMYPNSSKSLNYTR